jgi:hypothetical protein
MKIKILSRPQSDPANDEEIFLYLAIDNGVAKLYSKKGECEQTIALFYPYPRMSTGSHKAEIALIANGHFDFDFTNAVYDIPDNTITN